MKSAKLISLVLAAFMQKAAVNAKCNICGEGNRITNEDATIRVPGAPQVSCIQLQEFDGLIEENLCAFLPTFVSSTCGCKNAFGLDPTPRPTEFPTPSPTASPTKAPVPATPAPTPAPTFAPTSSPTSAPTPSPITPEPTSIEPVPTAAPLPDIVSTAVDAGFLNFLASALEFTGLVDALAAPNGPYTVFAPVDAAFTSLPSDVFEQILTEDFKDVLTNVLLYHVVSGEILSTDLEGGASAVTLNGASLVGLLKNGTAYINGSPLTAVDVAASNGVVHVIEGVLAPPDLFASLVDFIAGNSTLIE